MASRALRRTARVLRAAGVPEPERSAHHLYRAATADGRGAMVGPGEWDRYKAMLRRRLAREPVQYMCQTPRQTNCPPTGRAARLTTAALPSAAWVSGIFGTSRWR